MKTQINKKVPFKMAKIAHIALGLFAAGQAFAAADPLNFDIATLQSSYQYIVYGDAQSYALQVACVQSGQQQCDYYVQGSSGQIKNLVVNGVGSDGGPATTNDYNGSMDDAYALPNTPKNPKDSQLSDWFFQTGGATIGTSPNDVTFGSADPLGGGEWGNGTTTGDLANAWDTKLSSLMDYTQNRDPVFFFLNNQANADNKDILAADQTLAGWARLWITDDRDGAVIGVWEFTNNNHAYDVVPNGGGGIPVPPPYGPGASVGDYGVTSSALGTAPDVFSDKNTDYVLSGGRVCFDQQGAAPAPGDPIVPCSGAFDYSVDNNLGSNQAAYALFFPEMNTEIELLKSQGWGNYSLHVDVRLGCDPAWYGSNPNATNIESACLGKRLTNGAEAIFIGAAFERPPFCEEFPDDPRCNPPTIPEPNSLALLGLGLAALGASIGKRFGKRRQAA